MQRLLIVLIVLMLAGSVAMAQTYPNPAYGDLSTPVTAEASYHATVDTYALVQIIPPGLLSVPGDPSVGTPGEAYLGPDLGPDLPPANGGVILGQVNTTCEFSVEVTEFNSDLIDGEKLWTMYKGGWMYTGLTPQGSILVPGSPPTYGWVPFEDFSGYDWVQVVDGFGANSEAYNSIMPPGLKGGTMIIHDITLDPVLDDARYARIFWGVGAKNRIDVDGDPPTPTSPWESRVYETIALQGDYTATMYATISAP